MAKIKVLINGCKGKMGQQVIQAVSKEKNLEIVASCDAEHDLEKELKKSKAQVAVDFTHPAVAVKNTRRILESGVRPVIGTTGFTLEEIDALKKLAAKKKLGGLIAPNFAIGVLLMNRFSQEAVKFFDSVEIVEMHHNQKADAPSGTAAQTAQLINKVAGKRLNHPLVKEEEKVERVRGGKIGEIPVHSIRLPGFLAHQEVLFGGGGQVLTIRHDATSREAYMPGVVLAINKVMETNQLVYGLENLIFD